MKSNLNDSGISKHSYQICFGHFILVAKFYENKS